MSLTLFLGRFFGLSCLLMCGALLARPTASLTAIADLMARPGLLLVTGICTLFAGVATVLGHNVWSGGAVAVAVTVLGWLMLVKGFALMAVPPAVLRAFYRGVHYPERFRLVMAVSLGFSAWLTIASFLG